MLPDELDAIAEVMHESITAELDPVITRLATIELRQPVPGPAGRDGARGEKGLDGQTGTHGRDGVDGKNGVGIIGADGKPGRDGVDGRPGLDGKDGIGLLGPEGKPGRDGFPGKDGAPGLNGKDGAIGLNGKDGAVGLKGEPGPPGEIPDVFQKQIAALETRLAAIPPPIVELAPDDIAASVCELLRKHLAGVIVTAPVLTQKRIIRDPSGKVDRVVEERVS